MQTQITKNLANGVVGEFYDNSPKKVDTYILESGAVDNVVGHAYTSSSEGIAIAGGAGLFVGLLVNPKQYANYSIGLGATNVVANSTQASLSKMGRVWADVGGAGSVDDDVFFDNITGALGVGTAGAGQTQISNCKIFYYPATSNGLCVLELLN